MTNPTKVFKCGSVRASLWANSRVVEGEMVQIFSVTLDRVYKDDEQWKYSKQFRIEDLPKIAIVVGEIYKSLRLESKNLAVDIGEDSTEFPPLKEVIGTETNSSEDIEI